VSPHPATRKAIPERKPVVAPQSTLPPQPPVAPQASVTPQSNTRASEEQSSPGAKKISPNKLKKKEAGGFRKLFGRKKSEMPTPAPTNHLRVSEDYPQAHAPEAARSVSRVEDHQPMVREASPAYSAEQSEHRQDPSPPYERSPAASSADLADPRRPSPPLAPGSGQYEQQQADQAFSRFDQGPMDDMPAFVPDDESDEEVAAAPDIARRQVAQHNEPPSPVTPSPYGSAPMQGDVSEESITLKLDTVPSNDRWAQIRKNAAERAARLSEEQVRRSRSQSQSQRTDEGETSGEETIESRVARIKARVAELTGNVDAQPAPNYGAAPAR